MNFLQPVNIEEKNILFPYFTIHDDLLPTALKCKIETKKNYSCFYVQKN